MSISDIGRILLIIGVGLAILGGALLFLGKLPIFDRFGNLPGDIRIQAEGFSCIFPLASMLLVSIVLTVLLNILFRLINR